MRQHAVKVPPRRFWLVAVLSGATAALIAACKSTPLEPPKTAAEPTQVSRPMPGQSPKQMPEPSSPIIGPITSDQGSARSSGATTPRAYRSDGATHVYGLNADKIFKGKMPPLLYAIGVLSVEIDRVGRVTRLDWMRAPKHAPEVVAEIERMVRSAAPFPAPTRMGKVVYTDTWLWHKSGKFQLDTLTEGQN